jgi:hypothetical protein
MQAAEHPQWHNSSRKNIAALLKLNPAEPKKGKGAEFALLQQNMALSLYTLFQSPM